MRIQNQDMIKDISGTDMTSNITSAAIYLGHIANFSIQAVFTGATIDGSFKLQSSNDAGPNNVHEKNQATIVNWTDVGNTNQAIVAAGDHMYNIQNCGYRWVRLVWTDSASAAGTITVARFNVKGI